MPALSEVIADKLGGTVRAGLGWWLSELANLMPAPAIPQIQRARATIRLLRDVVEIDRILDGKGERYTASHPIDELDDESWEQLGELIHGQGAELVLTPPAVYSMTVTLPRAARTRLRSAIPLQLSEHAPVEPVFLVWTIYEVRREAGQIKVGVVMALRRRVEALGQLFEERGIPMPPIVTEVGDKRVQLAPGYKGQRGLAWTAASRRALLLAALILSAPLLTLMGAWIMTASNEQAIASLEPVVAPKLAEDRRAREAERLRQALVPLYAHPSASTLIEDLARRVPETAHAVELSRDADGSVRLAIETPDPDLVRPRLIGDRHLGGLREVSQLKTDSGSLRVDYVAGP